MFPRETPSSKEDEDQIIELVKRQIGNLLTIGQTLMESVPREFLTSIASLHFRYFTELQDQGFTEDQALQLLTSTDVMSHLQSAK